MEKEDFEYIKAVEKFKTRVTQQLRRSASKFSKGKPQSFVMRDKNSRSEAKLVDSIQPKIRKIDGIPESISFSFERHGIFVQKGVSKKHPVTNPRKGYDWFNPVFEKNIPDLADSIMVINGNKVLRLK